MTERNGAGAPRPVFLCAVLGSVLALSCSFVEPLDEQTFGKAIPFIQDGVTPIREVTDRLGEPGHRYEEGRIIAYTATCGSGLWHDLAGNGCDGGGQYSLILVFGQGEVLERHSFVREH